MKVYLFLTWLLVIMVAVAGVIFLLDHRMIWEAVALAWGAWLLVSILMALQWMAEALERIERRAGTR